MGCRHFIADYLNIMMVSSLCTLVLIISSLGRGQGERDLPDAGSLWTSYVDQITALDELLATWDEAPHENVTITERPTFPCSPDSGNRSQPTTVHELRPGDISIVAALGDSITAGNGINARYVRQVHRQYRGFSWSIGGEVGYDENSHTLPNMLKHWNPDLLGYSLDTGQASVYTAARMNQAVPGSIARDLPNQAVQLIAQLHRRNYPLDAWKIITIFIGGNDLCRVCDYPDGLSPANFIRRLQATLDTLHSRLTHAFVQVVGIFDLSILGDTVVRPTCRLLHQILCPCGVDPDTRHQVSSTATAYQNLTRELINSGRYDTRDNFTVVYQPFLQHMKIPKKQSGKTDVSYLSPDCFHFSRKGHNVMATMLWRAMFEPVQAKSLSFDFNITMYCPNEEDVFQTMNNNHLTKTASHSIAYQPQNETVSSPSVPGWSLDKSSNIEDTPLETESMGKRHQVHSDPLWIQRQQVVNQVQEKQPAHIANSTLIQELLQKPTLPKLQQPIQQPVAAHQPVQQLVEVQQPIQQLVEVQQPVPQLVDLQQPVQQRDGVQQPVQQLVELQQPAKQLIVAQQRIQQQVAAQQQVPAQLPVQQLVAAQQPIQQQVAAQQPIQQQVAAQEPVQQQVAAKKPVQQQVAGQQPIQHQVAAQLPVQQQGPTQLPVQQQVAAQQRIQQQVPAQEPVQQQVAAKKPVQQQVAAQQPIQQQVVAQLLVQQQLAAQQPIQQPVAAQQPVQQQVAAQLPVQQQDAAQKPLQQQVAAQQHVHQEVVEQVLQHDHVARPLQPAQESVAVQRPEHQQVSEVTDTEKIPTQPDDRHQLGGHSPRYGAARSYMKQQSTPMAAVSPARTLWMATYGLLLFVVFIVIIGVYLLSGRRLGQRYERLEQNAMQK